MRKLFLTSGLVLCMASNAIAATDIDSSGNVGGSAATCVYNVLDTYEGSSSFDAKWTPINYTITYAKTPSTDTQGTSLYGTVSGSTPASQSYDYDETKALTANGYSLTGYTFAGWTGSKDVRTVSGSGSLDYTNSESITYKYPGNATLTAKWAPICSGAITLDPKIYSSNNHSGTALYTNNSSDTNKLDTLLATTSIYTLYNNGMYTGSGCTGSVTASNLIPAKAGYTFGGFYNNGSNGAIGSTQYLTNAGAITDAGKRAVTSTNGTSTWYAKWTPKNYTITYAKGTKDVNNNSLYGTISGTTPTSQTYAYDSTAALSSNGYSLTGYTFSGWSGTKDVRTVSGSGSLAYTDAESITYKYPGDATLTAKWTPNCYGGVTLDANKYNTTTPTTKDYTISSTPSSIYVKYNTGIYSNSTCGTSATITAPSLTGYTFGGYYTEKNGGGTQMTNTTTLTDAGKHITAGATWYAKWTANSVTNGLTYSCGTAPTVGSTQLTLGGTAPSSVNTTYDSSYTLASTTTCALSGSGSAGYHWGGWSCQVNPEDNSEAPVTYASTGSGTSYSVSKTINKWKATSAVTCTAVWTGNTYNITYAKATTDTMGTNLVTAVTGSMSNQSFTYNDSANLSANTYTVPTGYTFTGWTTTTDVTLVAGGNRNYGPAANVTYRYPGNATLTMTLDPNKSGAISLVSSVYPGNDRTQTATYTTSTSEAVTNPTTTTVYTLYNNGIYSALEPLTPIVAANMKPAKAGYKFKGFFGRTDSSSTTQYIDADGNATTDGKRAMTATDGTDTWYANWEAMKYKVVYEAGAHGTGSDYTHSNGAQYDSAYTTKKLADTGITANTGYTFAGWKGNNINGGSDPQTYSENASAGTYKRTSAWTLTAQWTANSHTITYTCGDKPGSEALSCSGTSGCLAAAPTASTVAYDGTYTLPSNAGTCQYRGWSFDGWKCNYTLTTGAESSSYGATYAGGATGTFKTDANVTCKAKWKANTITTNWSANGGSIGTAGGASCTYDGSISLPSNVTKPGYTFTGWTVTNTSN